MSAVELAYRIVGRTIAAERTRRGMSQSELAARLRPPLTRAAICNMEGARQRVMLHVLIDIADALEISLGMIARRIARHRVSVERESRARARWSCSCGGGSLGWSSVRDTSAAARAHIDDSLEGGRGRGRPSTGSKR